jgi:two-component system sensor histidine kinase KdpD
MILRTPLHAIKTAAASVTSDGVRWAPEEIREFSMTIDGEADRLNALVDNLLSVGSLQAGALPVSLGATHVDPVVRTAIASLPEASSQVLVSGSEGLPTVPADPGLLERAVAIVLANATQWSPLGAAVRLVAGLFGDQVRIRVIDQGPGVAPERRDQRSRRLQRLGDRTTAGPGGLGLGLAIARGFVDAMGGDVALDGMPGGGATFVFTLQLAARRVPGAEPQRHTGNPAPQPLMGGRE